MQVVRGFLLAAVAASPVFAQSFSKGKSAPAVQRAAAPTQVGPEHGTVIVVGGGAMGPEVYNAFINAAGGPNALIVIVPTAGGDSVYGQDEPSTRGWKAAGAKNLYVYHTTNRKVADSDDFVAVLKRAGGIWFDGGRQFHLVDSYGGTKSETEFMNVLNRGGVIAGSSAGASILGDFLVRGAPSNNNFIMDYPGYEKGFAYLRGVGIDQHVVARERLPDLADSLVSKFPNMQFISEDEGTAWLVRGDTATIIGRDKAFSYNASDKDPGKPFLTLYPGDKFNLATRTVIHRALDDSPVKAAFVDQMFRKYDNPAAGGAAVQVSENGEVFIDRAYGLPAAARFMPSTTVPQFNVGDIREVFSSICSQLPEAPAGRGGGRGRGNAPPETPFQACVARRVGTPVGFHKTTATADGQVTSDVDELYRLALGLDQGAYERGATSFDSAKGWTADTYKGVQRLTAYGAAGGKRAAFVRIPSKHASIIILTNDDNADAKSMADRITDKLLSGSAN